MLPVLPALSTMQSPTEPGSCYKSRGNAGQRAMELNAKLGQRGTFTPSKRSDAQHIILDSPHALTRGTFEMRSIVGGVASCACSVA